MLVALFADNNDFEEEKVLKYVAVVVVQTCHREAP